MAPRGTFVVRNVYSSENMGASLKSETHGPAGWRARAAACRAMAVVLGADSGRRILVMAEGFEQKADDIERAHASGCEPVEFLRPRQP